MKNNRIPRPGMVLLLLARPAPAPADDNFVPNIIVTNNVEPPSSGFRQQTRRSALRSRRLGCTPRHLPVHHESAMSLPGLRPHQPACRIETSTNLNSPTNWLPIFTNFASYWHTNFNTTNDARRFYRAITN